MNEATRNNVHSDNVILEVTTYSYKTNGDHIRSMTDEELSAMIDSSGYCLVPSGFVNTEFCEATSDCKSCILNWLKQPYKSV